jgi:hypothetical protein
LPCPPVSGPAGTGLAFSAKETIIFLDACFRGGCRPVKVPINGKYMKKIFARPIDFSKVETLVYHLPDGPAFSMEMNEFADMFNFEMEFGDICDTSEIDGVIHFFPKGNA